MVFPEVGGKACLALFCMANPTPILDVRVVSAEGTMVCCLPFADTTTALEGIRLIISFGILSPQLGGSDVGIDAAPWVSM